MFPQLGSDKHHHSCDWHSSYWAPVRFCDCTLVYGGFSHHSCAFFCCALLCILIVDKTSSLSREVKRLISSCGSPGQLQGSILRPPTCTAGNTSARSESSRPNVRCLFFFDENMVKRTENDVSKLTHVPTYGK
jgi:hypothetical protein